MKIRVISRNFLSKSVLTLCLFVLFAGRDFVHSRAGLTILDPAYSDFFVSGGLEFHKFYEDSKISNMVMVSSNRYTFIGQQLRQHPSAVAILNHQETVYDTIYFNFTNSSQRDAVAVLAHQDNGFCGAMVPAHFGLTASPGDALSAIWSPSVKIDSVQSAIDTLSAAQITTQIATLEGLGSRFHTSTTGSVAVSTIKGLWTANLPSSGAIAETSNASTTSQNNLVVTLPGVTDDTTTVIIGAHLDSINRSDLTQAPGADDDASGIATLTEVLRVIKERGLKFNRRVEFHGYAGEEVGLLGSSTLAASYASTGRKIAGMFQLDMNGFTSTDNSNNIYLVTNDTSVQLRRQLKDLLSTYTIGLPVEMSLSAGTSDHKSWTNSGFHAVFPFEHPTDYNKSIHTSADKSNLLDTKYSLKFAKLALAWLSHNAGLTGVDAAHTTSFQRLTTSGLDIKTGIIAGGTTGDRVIVSAPETAKSATTCILTKATDTSCAKPPRDMTLEKSSGGRSFFYEPSDQTLAASEIHRITVYDDKGITLGIRAVKLVAKK